MDFKVKLGEMFVLTDGDWKITLRCNVCGVEEQLLENFLLHSLHHSLSVSPEEVLGLIQKLSAKDLKEEVVEENPDLLEADPLSYSLNDVKVEDIEGDPILEAASLVAKEVINNSRRTRQAPINDNKETTNGSEEQSVPSAESQPAFHDDLIDEPFSESEDDDSDRTEIAKKDEPKYKKTHKGWQCQICGKTTGLKAGIQNHVRIHSTEDREICDICGAAFACVTNLKVHRYRHLGIKPYSCEHCDKKFTTSTELRSHTRMHTGEKPFSCKECSKTYKNRNTLLTHIRRRHTNERPFICAQCGKSFLTMCNLKEHQRSHSDVRSFKCDTCEATFKRPTSLRTHRQLHAEKKYTCTVCGTKFAQSAGLHSHMKSHARKDKKNEENGQQLGVDNK